VITIHQRQRQTDGQTDGQTDRQTTCDRNTALCTKVHRAVKICRSNVVTVKICTLSLTRKYFTVKPALGLGLIHWFIHYTPLRFAKTICPLPTALHQSPVFPMSTSSTLPVGWWPDTLLSFVGGLISHPTVDCGSGSGGWEEGKGATKGGWVVASRHFLVMMIMMMITNWLDVA